MQNIHYKGVLRLMESLIQFTYLWSVKRVVLCMFEKLTHIICEDNLLDWEKAERRWPSNRLPREKIIS